MTGFAFTWHGLQLEARCSGALWWPEERWLVVADLHLGKSERMARRGGALLPPYEGIETLRRLEAEAEALDPAVIVSLGDGFDDDAAAEGLDPAVEKAVAALGQGRRLLWIAGNHDPKTGAETLKMGRATLRHEPEGDGPDISGHFHPVVRLAGARRRALLVGPSHMILPAFGAYTGGLDAGSQAITRWVPHGFAVACLHKALPVPLRAA
ncbi:ligase-associated DNA damage response endonuclease PdeM [Paracoccus sp. MC1862]|uniref:ligase-associated DNA damage response endonuclease PdeM n=1 Tax=Paracoccus sp. MC1862 TaxID=2760307 RepID=UPI00160252C1|nr:ligase-associated DNA damage response endonuclease PdeM [Paracoccus sp. MC1862]MBB1497574.1 ligase-associated DNA damage response endonuclease PdeM [Paracoccus sp. MC1862]QQO44023.1 ligase-associated DNA damage response endonuclease PdeM [Paracoccus sp. MC1862]